MPAPMTEAEKTELVRKFGELQTELKPADLSGALQSLRDIYDWTCDHASIAFDVLSLVPVTAPFAPIVKVVIGVALLPADGRAARDACEKLRIRLFDIYSQSYDFMADERLPIDIELDNMFENFRNYVLNRVPKAKFNTALGLQKKSVVEYIQDQLERINNLQKNHVDLGLRKLLRHANQEAGRSDALQKSLAALEQSHAVLQEGFNAQRQAVADLHQKLAEQSISFEDYKTRLFERLGPPEGSFVTAVLTLFTSPDGGTSISSYTPGGPGAYPRTLTNILSEGGSVVNDGATSVGPSTAFYPATSSITWDSPPDAIVSFVDEQWQLTAVQEVPAVALALQIFGLAGSGRAAELEAVLAMLDVNDRTLINEPSPTGSSLTPLQVASVYGHLDVVQLLLKVGVEVNAIAKTAVDLHFAAINDRLEVVQALLNTGADVHAKDADDRTALHFASGSGHLEVVQALLKAGADVNAKDAEDWTALHFASLEGHFEVVQALLKAGADVHAKDADDRTALHSASGRGHLEVVRALLNAGGDVHATSKDGWTAIIAASTMGHCEVAWELLAWGADPFVVVEDHDGKTVVRYDALKIATDEGHTAVVDLLNEWMLSHPTSTPADQPTERTDAAELVEPSLAAASVTSTSSSAVGPSNSPVTDSSRESFRKPGKLQRVKEKIGKFGRRGGQA